MKSPAVETTRQILQSFYPFSVFPSCTLKESVHQLGWSMLRSLYPKAVDIAKTLTGKENTSEAVRLFRQFIHSPSMYFNEEPFPKNESNDKAHRKCNSEAGEFTL